jgi:hypothetical protein
VPDPNFQPLSASEREWVAGVLALGSDAGLDPDDLHGVSEFLDRELAAWLAEPEHQRPDPNSLINVVGVTVGEHFVRNGFEWRIVTDEFGTDLAVVREPGQLPVVPTNLVAKRWSEPEFGWVLPVVSALRDHPGRPTATPEP